MKILSRILGLTLMGIVMGLAIPNLYYIFCDWFNLANSIHPLFLGYLLSGIAIFTPFGFLLGGALLIAYGLSEDE